MTCECGCGERVTPGARWIRGHHRTRRREDDISMLYRVDPSTGCWVWQRYIDGKGYGIVRAERRMWKAHRYVYERARGPVPEGLQLDHLCRNRACVNPDHLEPVTPEENSRRGVMTKLDMATAGEIRRLAVEGARQRDLATQFGVSKGTIYNVLYGLKWTA